MNYTKLNLSQWSRKNQFEFFKKYDNPFFNICSSLDVTELYKLCQQKKVSFSTALLFAAIDSANKIKEFRYRLKGDGVVVYDSIYAGSTILNDDETFNFCYFDYNGNFGVFNKNALQQIINSKKGIIDFDGRNEDLDIIHFSTIPWISFTSFSNPRNYKTNDSIPKIVFGKHYEKKGRKHLPISVEVHHALMDGLHLGQYLEKLQNLLNYPNFIR
jgi:chloramphenicol O-acetyltransferase type A